LRLRKIIKFIAARWQILRLKCSSKFDFDWGFAPDLIKALLLGKGATEKGGDGRGAIFSPQYFSQVVSSSASLCHTRHPN